MCVSRSFNYIFPNLNFGFSSHFTHFMRIFPLHLFFIVFLFVIKIVVCLQKLENGFSVSFLLKPPKHIIWIDDRAGQPLAEKQISLNMNN